MVQIEEVAKAIGAVVSGPGQSIINDITHDSRQAKAGTIFVAIRGATVDAHRFIDDVVRRGASAILSEFDPPDNYSGTWLKVPDARIALAFASSIIHGQPSQHLSLVGVTGTNGKTTTTYLCSALAESAGQKTAMLTTVEYRIGNRHTPAVRTTPESSDTNRFLAAAVNEGWTLAVIETSSQAIELHRCDVLQFKVAVFTNLTRDHLDYHGTMENYFKAKKQLFDGGLGEPPASSVINIDDEWGRSLAAELSAAGQRIITYSQNAAAVPGPGADLIAENVSVSLTRGTSFRLLTGGKEYQVESPLVGRPHVYNMLAAAGAA